MDKKLPARPNLEHLRTQAKALLSRLHSGDNEAAQTFIDHLPVSAGKGSDEVRTAGYRLADAQSAIARQSGFESWPGLTRHVEQLRQLEGTWAFVDLEVDGNVVPAEMLVNSRMLIDGDRFRMESPEANYEGIFNIDVEQTPHQIDIEFIEGPEAGNWSYGIFELDGDQFRICLGLTGASRPLSFATSAGSGHALENLKRVSKDRPVGVEGGTPGAPQPESWGECDAGDFPEMTPELEALQGEWLPLELNRDGQPLPAEYLPHGSRTGTGNEVKVVFGGQVMLYVKMRIDPTQSPVAVDYIHLSNALKGQVGLAIMKWEGEEAIFCSSNPGMARPTTFEPGPGITLSRWRRKG